MTVYPETARSLCARFDSSPCIDRGQEIVVIGCDLYNGSITGWVACNMNANSNASANHAGPSVLVVEYCGDRTDASCSTEKAYCIPKNPVDGRQQAVCFQSCGDRANPSVSVSDTAYCIPANPMSDRQQAVCIPLTNRGVASDGGGVFETVRAESHGALPLVCFTQNQREEVRDLGGLLER